jgi:tRNA 2-thiouridine synthesizing protein A
MVEVDVRGLSCPLPLMRTAKALESDPGEITVLVDSGTAKQNVVNLLDDRGFDVTVEAAAAEWRISATK